MQQKEYSEARQPRPVPIAASSAYISVLMHQRERLKKMHQDIVEESVVVPLSTMTLEQYPLWIAFNGRSLFVTTYARAQ